MQQPLISIIIPVYNVEPYIDRCIQSVVSQTYKNLEIILVDDESPDRCGIICDDYAKKDKRITVIHRKNGGLSAARNSGLDVCHGEYIGFVDSDDFVSPEMYEQLYHDIETHHTRLAFCHLNLFHHGEKVEANYGEGSTCHPKEYVMRRALKESIWWAACTKLFHKSLFESIRFPEGKTNEDLAIMMQIYDQCDYIAINHNKLYNYWVREGSITTSAFNIRKFDIIENAQGVADYMHEHHPDLENAAKGIMLSSAIGLLKKIMETDQDSFPEQQRNIYGIVRREWPTLLWNANLSLSQRILLTAAAIHPNFLAVVFRLRKQLLRA